MKKKKRIDLLLVEQKLASSRTQAQAFILSRSVFVNHHPVIKPGELVPLGASIEVKKRPLYVSRGGLKLEKALKHFQIDVSDKICLDIGSSTGGFTDCLLKHGAKKVYAVDSGSNQLAYSLRYHPKVVVYEKTNARYLKKKLFSESISMITMDVSFISTQKIIPSLLELTLSSAPILVLFKPQFEGRKDQVQKGGLVKSPENHFEILNLFYDFIENINIHISLPIPSPITGISGNREYLLKINPLKPYENISKNLLQESVDVCFKTHPPSL